VETRTGGGRTIRLLVAEDSPIMRKVLRQMLESEADFEVVAEAANGREAVEMARETSPDVISMDVVMPVMDGVEALRVIMKETPTRVLMVSGVTTEGAQVTMEALAAGAVDFLPKPTGQNPLEIRSLRDELVAKVRTVAASRLEAMGRSVKEISPAVARPAVAGRDRVVVIGTSTGGPRALQTVIPMLPEDLPAAVLLVQHMPKEFTPQLARRLDAISEVTVREAAEGDRIEAGTILLAPGHSHMVVRDRERVGLEQEPSDHEHRPAVDVLADSAAAVFGRDALGVIMTGMGQDGRRGMAALKEKGATIIAQDEATSVIYGMPKAVVAAGLADVICPLEGIARAVVQRLT
jgi:two-component system chemotaxis response regulator CheB